MLIASPRLSRADIQAWDRLVVGDMAWSRTLVHRRRVERAERALEEFAAEGPAYVGVSWGKDSVVVADLARRIAPHLPLVWVMVRPICNPDCELVEREYVLSAGQPYKRITTWATWGGADWHATGTLEAGIRQAEDEFGHRHISGVRAQESSARALRMYRWGESTERTCAPIGFWQHEDVFAYLVARDLPIHPAYAQTYGGQLDRGRLRVASLGGKRGQGWGRAEWERRYYAAEVGLLARGPAL